MWYVIIWSTCFSPTLNVLHHPWITKWDILLQAFGATIFYIRYRIKLLTYICMYVYTFSRFSLCLKHDLNSAGENHAALWCSIVVRKMWHSYMHDLEHINVKSFYLLNKTAFLLRRCNLFVTLARDVNIFLWRMLFYMQNTWYKFWETLRNSSCILTNVHP